MKSSLALSVTAGLHCLLTGCVVFPHREMVAPPASGRVLDAQDLRPVAQAMVSRRVEALDRARVTTTDHGGEFEIRKDTTVRWLPFVCYVASSIEYQIEVHGFQPYQTNLYGGGSFQSGRQPHDLGEILMQRNHE